MIRLASGVVLAAAAVAAILFLPVFALRLLACAVAVLAAFEYDRIAVRPAGGAIASAVTLTLVAAACWLVAGAVPQAFLLVAMAAFAAVAVRVLVMGHVVHAAAASAFALVYIGVPLGMLVAVHGRGGWPATLFLLATVVVSDSAQYYTGRAFGRRPLAPAISPKKTMEGAAGGLVIGTAFVMLVGPRVLPWSLASAAMAGVAIVILGIAGDLFESRIKRDAGVKDSSSIIPGHGGVLDRIDALLFAAPAFYLFVI